MALNGGPMFTFSEAVSFVVNCQDQEEIDEYWGKLLDEGKAQQCGWLKDKYGISWQILPSNLGQLMQNPDPAKANRIMLALMKMVKIDIKMLRNA